MRRKRGIGCCHHHQCRWMEQQGEDPGTDASAQQICVRDLTACREYEPQKISGQEDHVRVYVKIQDGCDRFCSYCMIPFLRGRSRSRDPEDIRKEAADLAAGGLKEIVLTGIDISSYAWHYGDSRKSMGLQELLEGLGRIPGLARIRLGSLEPDHITDEVIDSLKSITKFCPQFHLSLQSGCDRTLKRMNRHYTAEEYETLCNKLKNAFPGISLTTDIICGFPGETEQDFRETAAFAEKIGFMKVHVFPYSQRASTPAASYPDQIEKQTKLRRCADLQMLCDNLRLRFLESMVGTEQDVLFETPKAGLQQGYTKNYTPVCVRTDSLLTGQILRVQITGVANGICNAILL